MLEGTSRRDVIWAGEGADVISALSGEDLICAGAGTDTVFAGGGDDVVVGGPGVDRERGGGGADRFLVGGGADDINGGDGTDTLTLQHTNIGSIVDLPAGTAQSGMTVDEVAGIEDVIGSPTGDIVTGTEGDNLLVGGGGDDRLTGGKGDDSLRGVDGFDNLIGGPGNDTLIGGAEMDTAEYVDAGAVTVDLGDGVSLRQGDQDLLAGIEGIHGSPQDDVIRGTAARNFFDGRGGDDQLFGRAGDDLLAGSDGTDVVAAGTGNDRCFGEKPSSCELVAIEDMPGPPASKLAAPALPETVPGVVTPLPLSAATSYQLNARHDGSADDGRREPTALTEAWTTSIHGHVSYPLIAAGRVFVTVGHNGGPFGSEPKFSDLVAFDQATGDELWRRPVGGSYQTANLAYGDGRVYSVNYDGFVEAFDPLTGMSLWKEQPSSLVGSVMSPPTVVGERVYVNGSDRMAAASSDTGAMTWVADSAGESSPAVAGSGVYTGGACFAANRNDAETGGFVWRQISDCEGGTGRSVVLAGGYVYLREHLDSNLVLDAETAEIVAQHDAKFAPAFQGGRGFFVDNVGDLVARSAPSMAPLWTFRAPAALVTAPIVANGTVYVGTASGALYGIDAVDGSVRWSDDVGELVAPDDNSVATDPGTAVGQGMLVVTTTTGLRAYRHPTAP